jgi:hypothetical protein
MITESINKPDPFALSPSTRTTTLLACPARAMLLVIIARWSGASLLLGGLLGQPAPGDVSTFASSSPETRPK